MENESQNLLSIYNNNQGFYFQFKKKDFSSKTLILNLFFILILPSEEKKRISEDLREA